MPQETYLARKLRELGMSQDHHNTSNAKKLQFRVYFPRPPYGPVEYTAAKQGEGLNFVGQLLGHGGCTLKKIQQESGTRVEVHDGKGNLNGTHPSYTDPSLHAVVFAETREKLNKAVRMIAEVLQPLDTVFERFEVTPGGSALLKPVLPKKSRSTQSETSSQGGVWGRTSTPSSDAGSFMAQGADIDSAYVQESHQPWRSIKTFQTSPYKLQTCMEKTPQNKENGLCEMRQWDTWGRNDSDGYHQFTIDIQRVMSQVAERSRQQRQNWEQQYYENGAAMSNDATWHLQGMKINGANVNSSFSHLVPSNGIQFAHSLEKAPKFHGMDGFPLPNVYEDLIAAEPAGSAIEESRLTSAYRATMDSEWPSHKNI